MAGIDKTFASTWKDFKEVRDWAISVGTVKDEYGNELTPFAWFYYPELTEEEFNEGQTRKWNQAKERYAEEDGPRYFSYYIENYGEDFINNPELFFEVIIWNTSELFDLWLIRHCPLKIIQDRLREQYSSKYIEKALARTTIWDTFVREDNPDLHFSIQKMYDLKYSGNDIWWWIEPIDVEDPESPYHDESLYYFDREDAWHFEHEPYMSNNDDEWISSSCDSIKGKLTQKKLYRLLKKWNLPKGISLRFQGTVTRKGKKGHLIIKDYIVKIK